jgi:hypothetical protein
VTLRTALLNRRMILHALLTIVLVAALTCPILAVEAARRV